MTVSSYASLDNFFAKESIESYAEIKKEIQKCFIEKKQTHHELYIVDPEEDPDPLHGKNAYYLNPERFLQLKQEILSRGFVVTETKETIFSQYDHILTANKVTIFIPKKTPPESIRFRDGWQIDFKASLIRQNAASELQKSIKKTTETILRNLPIQIGREKKKLEKTTNAAPTPDVKIGFSIDESCPKGWEKKAANKVAARLRKKHIEASITTTQELENQIPIITIKAPIKP